MDYSSKLTDHRLVTADFAREVARFWLRKSRILILVDGSIQVLPFPAPEIANEFVISTEFGISVAIATLKSFSSGFSSFTVTVATRNGNGSPIAGHDITGFRFSDTALANFDQVWLFGINPGNVVPNSLDPAEDARIEQAGANPLSEAELAALAKWMDNGGGVFATGDHHFLGASMCHKVPRVGTMRRWKIADGVPTIGFTTRVDTNRPANSAQAAGAAVIPNSVETDFVPQSIEWVPFHHHKLGAFTVRKRPHPLLCHPTLGPIDILPDHPHEGLCYDFADPSWQSAKRDLAFDFAGYSNDHYPTVGGKRPLPQVVAWGTALADPPLNFAKGDQPHRRFPQIAAYDGQTIGIGRVVVDSTWHHWFDMNLAGLEARARQTGDRSRIDRILRYFVNVGVYLASDSWRAGQLLGWLKAVQLSHFGQQEVDLTASAIEIGRVTAPYVNAFLGPCWVTELVVDSLKRVDADFWTWLKQKIGDPNPCLSCPPIDLFESAVLGEMVRAAYSDMADLRLQIATDGQITRSPLLRTLDKAALEGALTGSRGAVDFFAKDLLHGAEEWAPLRGKAAARPG